MEIENSCQEKPLAGKRVLIVVENLPVPFDRRVWLEAKTLSGAGATVSVICPIGKGHDRRFETIEGIDVYRHPLPLDASGTFGYLAEYGVALFWEALLAFRVLRRQGIDVVHGCNPPDLIFIIALFLRPFGVKYIFDHHDISPELYEAKFNSKGLLWKVMLLLERITFKVAAVSIATNDSYQQIAIERGGMSADNVFVVRSGPDLSRLVQVEPQPRWRNGRSYMVAYVGVMGDQEGIDLLIESVRLLVNERGRADVQFVLVGGGPSLEKMRKLSSSLGLDNYVTFTGRTSDSELFEVLSTADLCVNPDRVNAMNDKSTMNKILEYMAFSKPIVQFDVKEGRFSAGEASLYAAANDTDNFASLIEELLADPTKRSIMGQIGRKRVEESLSWPHQAPQLLAAYKRALRRKDS